MTDPMQVRPSTGVKAMTEHAAYPWVAAFLGAAFIALGGVLIYKEPPADRGHMIFEGGIVGLGVLLVPGIATALAGAIKQIIGAVSPLLPWNRPPAGGA